MLTVRNDDIFKALAHSNGAILLHGCNCQGKYGSGFAKQVREFYPTAYLGYMDFCKNATGVILGSTSVVEVGEKKFIHNGFTQIYYGRNKNVVYVSYPAIRQVLTFAAREASRLNVPLYFPAIGVGTGGGDPMIIHRLMKEIMDSSVNAYLFIQP